MNEQVIQIPVGRVFEKGTEIPVQPVGSAKNDKTDVEEFYFGFHDQTMAPCVISAATDQIYVLDWAEVIALSIKAGILIPKISVQEEPKIIRV